MRDIPSEEENLPDVCPDDPEERMLYLRKFRGRYAKEIAGMDQIQILEVVDGALQLCPRLQIRKPHDVLRFMGLRVLLTPAQRGSRLLDMVIRRVLEATEDWSATKRLDFLYQNVVGRPVPIPILDTGPWYPEGPSLV